MKITDELIEEKQGKGVTISFRTTEGMKEYIHEHCKLLNVNQTDFIKRMIIDGKVKNEPNKRDLALLRMSIQRIGNNINQLAYGLNVAKKEGKLSEVDYQQMLETLLKINTSVVALWE